MTHRARVLQLAATPGGGLATHVVTLAQGLSRDKYDVRVLCPDAGELRRRLAELDIAADVLPFSPGLDLLGDLRLWSRLVAYVRKHGFDIVHTHSTKAGVWGRLAGRWCGVPILVHTANAYRFLRYARWSPRWAAYVAVEWVLGHAGSYVLAAGPSEAALTRDLRLAPRARQFVANNGVPPVRSASRDPTVRRRLGLRDGVPLVLTVGRLVAQKAPLTFVDAAALVAAERPDAAFVMVGDGELESAVRARARAHGIHERLVLISHLDDLGPLLLEADVFVMTSRYEGLSYAAAEAGARGRPMVLSDVAGLRDLIPDERTGCLVPAGDAALFASRIIELLADPARRAALGREAARRVATTFNAAGMIAATERVYDGLLERRVHAPR